MSLPEQMTLWLTGTKTRLVAEAHGRSVSLIIQDEEGRQTGRFMMPAADAEQLGFALLHASDDARLNARPAAPPAPEPTQPQKGDPT